MSEEYYWKIDKMSIYNHSSEEMKEIKDKEIDVIITSPPYNFKKVYEGEEQVYFDNIEEKEYYEMLRKVFKECYRVLKDDGVFFLNVGFNKENLKRAWEVLDVAEKGGFYYYQPIIWVKSFNGKGHFTPVSTNTRFFTNYEYIFILTKDRKKKADINVKKVGIPYTDKSNISRFNHEQDLRDAGNVWFIPYETKAGDMKTNYPSIFPFELVRRCLSIKKQKRKVLDPFMGSGTTLIVANEEGLEAYGYDIVLNMREIIKRKDLYDYYKGEKKND